MIQGVGHIGILVRDINQTVKKFTEALGLPMPLIKDVAERKMKVAVVGFGEITLEFIEDYSDTGAFAKIVRERGNTIHHFALLTDNIEKEIETLISRGVQMLDPVPKIGVRGKKIAFIASDLLDGISIELSEP